jgi:hypothetical protein
MQICGLLILLYVDAPVDYSTVHTVLWAPQNSKRFSQPMTGQKGTQWIHFSSFHESGNLYDLATLNPIRLDHIQIFQQ